MVGVLVFTSPLRADPPPPAPPASAPQGSAQTPVALAPPSAVAPPAPPSAPPATAQTVQRPWIDQRGLAWDLRLEGGIAVWTSRNDNPFWGRLHGGMLLWREPLVFGFGAFAEAGGLAGIGGGIMAEVTDIGAGWWAQAGVAGAEGPALVTHVALGWSFIGVEWQHRIHQDGSDNGIFIKLIAPLGIIFSRLAWHRQFASSARGSAAPAAPRPTAVGQPLQP